MATDSFSLEFDLSVTCVRCGIDRDFPGNDQPIARSEKNPVNEACGTSVSHKFWH